VSHLAGRLLPAAGAAVAAAVVVAGWVALPGASGQAPDRDWPRFYRPVARSLADGRGWSLAPGVPAGLDYPPGFPLLAAASLRCGDLLGIGEREALRGLGLLSVAAGGALVASTVGAVAGPGLALLGALLFGAYPPLLWMSSQPLGDVPFSALLAAALALWHRAAESPRRRAWPWAAVGLLAGAAALVRPIGLLVGALLALAVLVSPDAGPRPGRRARAAALVLAGWALALAPWQLWASARSGRFVLLSDGGAYSVSDGLTWGVRDKGYRSPSALPPDLRASMEGFAALGPNPAPREVAAEAARQLKERPSGFLKLAAWKLVRPLWGTDSGRWEGAVAAVNLTLLALFVWALRAARRAPRVRSRLVLAGSLLLLFWAMASAVLPIARYLAPPLALIAGLLPLALPPRRRSRAAEGRIGSR
jgi:hypothetical protein